MHDCIFKIHSTGRNAKQRETNVHGRDTFMLNCKLNARVSKVSIFFFFFCNETILKNVEKYYHIVKMMELEESRIPS